MNILIEILSASWNVFHESAIYMLFGFFVSVFAFFYALATLIQKIFTDTTVPGYATTIILVCFLGGVQLITIGILGEYVGRIFEEVKKRPLYLIDNMIGFEKQDSFPPNYLSG